MQTASTQCWWIAQVEISVGDDSLTLLTSCRRVPLVHELLWLTVGWSNLANRAERLDRSSSSIERTSVESSTTKHAAVGLDLSKRPSSLTNITGSVASCYKFHRHSVYLRPLNHVVLFTTITCRFNIRPYFLQNFSQLSFVTSSVSDGPLTQFIAKLSFAMQAIAWGQCNQAREAIYRCQQLKAIITI